jgi:ribosomal protein S18 acetylase RimI-like enzyme
VTAALVPATDFPAARLAELFTAGYEDYFVPFAVDEETFRSMVDVLDIDLSRSLVAVEDDRPVGLANLALRGELSWLGGIGVVKARRRYGVGEGLTRALLDRAREARAAAMWLEVIVENAPALRLYEKLGFERVRELEVLSLARGGPGGAAQELPLDVARALVREWREEPEPWQRADATVDRLGSREPGLLALVADDAAAVYRPGTASVALVQAAGSERGLAEISATLCADAAVSAVNYPAGGAVARALRSVGADVSLRQLEMVRPL